MGIPEKEIVQVLKSIVGKITDKGIVRRLDGGVNLLVRGVPRLPRDIDIRTNEAGYDIFKQTFLGMKKEEGYDEKKKKYYMIFDMQGVEVEIAYYDKEAGYMNMFEHIVEKNRNNITIPVLPLAQMKQFYTWIGSTEKIQLIEDFLIQNSTFKI